MACTLMTETLRRAHLKVLAASYEEARERFRPERIALYIPQEPQGAQVPCSHGFSNVTTQIDWSLMQKCAQAGTTQINETTERVHMALPAKPPGATTAAAVFLFDVPSSAAVSLRGDLFSVEALLGRAAAEVALLSRKLIIEKERVLPMASEVENWSGIRRAGLEAFKAGVHDMAISFLERARDLAEDWGPSPELATSLNDLGEVLRANERADEAAEQFQRGISVLEQAGKDGEVKAVALFNNYAGVLYAQRELKEAERFYRRALDIITNQAQQSKKTPAILSNLGVISVELGDRTAAEMWMHQAVVAAARAFGEDHPNTAKCKQKLEALRAS